jgi:hypothetical protein
MEPVEVRAEAIGRELYDQVRTRPGLPGGPIAGPPGSSTPAHSGTWCGSGWASLASGSG